MSPDSPAPSRQRKAWRFISAVGAVLAAFSLFASVWLYTQQQASREDSVRISCIELNNRHDRTVATLDRLLAIRARTASRSELQRLRESRTNTLLLISALAPRRDCDERVAQLTRQSNSFNP